MSGGIDSTVTAMLLQDQGYEIIGITMKTWDYATSGGDKKETGCCSLDSINDARSMAVSFGFSHYILDIRGEFGTHIIDTHVGPTPEPVVDLLREAVRLVGAVPTLLEWDEAIPEFDVLEKEIERLDAARSAELAAGAPVSTGDVGEHPP
jgi:hypothetical protein